MVSFLRAHLVFFFFSVPVTDFSGFNQVSLNLTGFYWVLLKNLNDACDPKVKGELLATISLFKFCTS